MKTLAIIAIVFISVFAIFQHKCEWKDCEMKGKLFFTSSYEEGSDGYYYELNHFSHPEWTKEECEKQVWEEPY